MAEDVSPEGVEEGLSFRGSSLVERLPATCPRCGIRFDAEVAVTDLGDPEYEDLDGAPRGANVGAREERLVSCPECACCLVPELFRDAVGAEASAALQRVDFAGLADPAAPWGAFLRASAGLEALGFSAGDRAFIVLEGAWSARAHDDPAADMQLLSQMAELFLIALREGSLTKGVVPTVRLLIAEAYRRLGLFDDARAQLDAFRDLDARHEIKHNREDLVSLRRREEQIRRAVMERDLLPRRFDDRDEISIRTA